jgi:hypothetical protein
VIGKRGEVKGDSMDKKKVLMVECGLKAPITPTPFCIDTLLNIFIIRIMIIFIMEEYETNTSCQIKCQHCGNWFRSGIQFGTAKACFTSELVIQKCILKISIWDFHGLPARISFIECCIITF